MLPSYPHILSQPIKHLITYDEASGVASSSCVAKAVLRCAAAVLAVQVTVDNETYDDRTIITVDSANRPGTLVEVVQCLTELGLNVKKARISSDGG
jgi:UTP:GlnB (protein PII) uridylyltransferase